MIDRPFRQYGIEELEALVARSDDDRTTLSLVVYELRNRRTERAARLLRRVEAKSSGQAPDLFGGASKNGCASSDRESSGDASPSSILCDTVADAPPPSTPSKAADDLPPPIDLSDIAYDPFPAEQNKAADILSAWTALEALSPQTYRRPFDLVAGDRRRIVNFQNDLPWPAGRSIPKCRLYYQVPLGVIRMGPATKALVDAFGQNEALNPRAQERSVIAAVLVDKNGAPLEDKSVAISSFAWALPEVLHGRLASLGRWTAIEDRLVSALTEVLIHRDEKGKIQPLNEVSIDVAHRWLVRQLDLPGDLIEPPAFAMKLFHHFKAKEDPEVSLLNSFYMRDLARAQATIASQTAPDGLMRYLGQIEPSPVRDLLKDRSAIEEAVRPTRIPPVRWPSPGGFPLVTLQQAAVNLARSELGQTEGLLAVNGPPGTGKTTLLRDLVAGCVLDRALAMSAFDDPEAAFTPSGQKLAVGGGAFLHLYRLHPSLKGHEVLVASSNNKAVENVSRELPASDAVGTGIEYLRTLSDNVHRQTSDSKEAQNDAAPETTWGMIAAVLGNAKNRSSFVQSFWWHDDCGLQVYLKAARGQSVVREVRDEDGALIERITPAIVRQECPPDHNKAHTNWRKAKERFEALHSEVCEGLDRIETARKLALVVGDERARLATLLAKHAPAASRVQQAETHVFDAVRRQTDAETTLTLASSRLEQHDHARPGWWARLFRTARFASWNRERTPLLNDRTDAAESVKAARDQRDRRDTSLADAQQALALLKQDIKTCRSVIKRGEAALAPWRTSIESRFVDGAYFERGHDAWNLDSPWVPDALHKKREAVFEAALGVHRAFLDVAAQKMQHNLGVLMNVMQGGKVRPEHRALLPDLWASLFAVVPVVSTTFASVDRMLGGLEAGAFGWLLIDEAGQAVPQAAVGAIYRAKRTIAVGDPLQIPPVVTLPDRLVRAVCDQFGVDADRWAAPEASTQTLADRASLFQASFRGEIELRRVGAPLLVHRRCQNPMFDISNAIAYDGQMVHAPGSAKAGPVTRTLGPSRWLDIDGEAESKWCPEEGNIVVRLLRTLAADEVRDPNLFIISPFRDVANGIRARLRNEEGLLNDLGVDAQHWLSDRIGTIHTAQGREAEAVILLLGAPAAAHSGARVWAATSPNILNVAVSRAKQSLYVVGSHGAWSGIGHARTLANALPTTRSDKSTL